MKSDEAALLLALQESKEQCYVRRLARNLQIPEKRAAYICDKWTAKGWYDYGVSVLAGWLTEEGKAVQVKTLHELESNNSNRTMQQGSQQTR